MADVALIAGMKSVHRKFIHLRLLPEIGLPACN